jgi:hypothetical protein
MRAAHLPGAPAVRGERRRKKNKALARIVRVSFQKFICDRKLPNYWVIIVLIKSADAFH